MLAKRKLTLFNSRIFIYLFLPACNPPPFKPGWMTSLFRLGFLSGFGISLYFSQELTSGRTQHSSLQIHPIGSARRDSYYSRVFAGLYLSTLKGGKVA